MTLPAASAFTGGSITEAQFKTAITELRAYLAALLGTDETNKVAALTALGALMNSGLAKTGAYTVVAADKGRVIRCNGTFTLSLTAAATLGDGFAFAVLNEGSGTITIDPSGSEQIDGGAIKLLQSGKLVVLYCNGSSYTSVGYDEYPERLAQAWVNFDATRNASGGTDSNNTNRFIRASHNVSSVMKNADGDFTVSFSSAFANANLSVCGSASGEGGVYCVVLPNTSSPTSVAYSAPTTTACRLCVVATAINAGQNSKSIDIHIFAR